MRFRFVTVAASTLVAVLASAPARAQAPTPADASHEHATATQAAGDQHAGMAMPMTVPFSDDQLDALVAKMKAATGAARIDAIEELLGAVVQNEKATGGMHMNMPMNTMSMGGNMRMGNAPAPATGASGASNMMMCPMMTNGGAAPPSVPEK